MDISVYINIYVCRFIKINILLLCTGPLKFIQCLPDNWWLIQLDLKIFLISFHRKNLEMWRFLCLYVPLVTQSFNSEKILMVFLAWFCIIESINILVKADFYQYPEHRRSLEWVQTPTLDKKFLQSTRAFLQKCKTFKFHFNLQEFKPPWKYFW